MRTFGGPMFDPAEDVNRQSLFRKTGGHYNIFAGKDGRGVQFLRHFFPDGEANEMNFVLFSTSGVHGTYTTLEDIEHSLHKYGDGECVDEDDPPDDYYCPEVTYLVVQPRIVSMTYGNARVTLDDIPFLRRLRESSWKAAQSIGKAEGR